MGYVLPPRPPFESATELIRRDVSPTLAHLYGIYSYREFGPPNLGQQVIGTPPPSIDWFTLSSYGLVLCVVALPFLIAWAVVW